jgi:hypothetical protein
MFGEIYGALRSVYFFCLCAGVLITSPSHARAHAVEDDLVVRAQQLNLSHSRAWDILLFYRLHGSERTSLIDDPRYFLSPVGKTDPSAELEATLRGFFTDPSLGDEHPRCRFPARYQWLREELAFDEDSLPQPVCGKLNEAMQAVDPLSAVLVFPSAHNNGPASMFGHTLLRIGSSYQSELLSYAVNYAAYTPETNGLVYAFKGIFGLYPGYFSILPYYEKVKEYNDLEHRDVWEYTLTLTPDEVRRMVLHIWELQETASDYYFFDENCSFMLLFLLEAARPDLKLAEEYWDRWGFWVMPVDTITAVRKTGLIGKVIYRPAQATRILHRASLLDDTAQQRAHDVALQLRSPQLETEATTPAEERRQVLDLAAEFVQYRYSRKKLTQEAFQKQFLAILKERSRLGPGETDAGKVPEPSQPEEGHLPGMMGISTGVRHNDVFVDLSWRPAYHDLMDPDAGYTKGAQINFMSASGRYYPQKRRVQLQTLYPVNIISLAPRDRFFQPLSWKVNGGLDRKPFADGHDSPFLRLNTGGGLSWEVVNKGFAYLFADADLNLSDRFPNKAAVGAGPSAGFLINLSGAWKAHLNGIALFYAVENHQYYRFSLDQRLTLSRGTGIELRTEWERSFDHDRSEASLSWVWYF